MISAAPWQWRWGFWRESPSSSWPNQVEAGWQSRRDGEGPTGPRGLRARSAIQGSMAGLSINRGHEGQFQGNMDRRCCVLKALAAVNETQIEEKTPRLGGQKRR